MPCCLLKLKELYTGIRKNCILYIYRSLEVGNVIVGSPSNICCQSKISGIPDVEPSEIYLCIIWQNLLVQSRIQAFKLSAFVCTWLKSMTQWSHFVIKE